MFRITLTAALVVTLTVLAGCETSPASAPANADYPTLCETGCLRHLEDDEVSTCSRELDACVSSCVEVTNGNSSLCATCLVDYMNSVYMDGDQCDDAAFDGQYCIDECASPAE